MQENERSAEGVKGMLIRTLDPAHPLVFRIYSEDKKTHKDYVIAHHDLSVVIADNYSSFYDFALLGEGYAGMIDYPSRLSGKSDLQNRKEG